MGFWRSPAFRSEGDSCIGVRITPEREVLTERYEVGLVLLLKGEAVPAFAPFAILVYIAVFREGEHVDECGS